MHVRVLSHDELLFQLFLKYENISQLQIISSRLSTKQIDFHNIKSEIPLEHELKLCQIIYQTVNQPRFTEANFSWKLIQSNLLVKNSKIFMANYDKLITADMFLFQTRGP